MDISIVILNYKSKDFTLNCLKSIKAADFNNLKYEIIVVDNNSEDNIKNDIKEHYSDILFIQNEKNIGMGAGNNVGIKKAQGKYIMIMNPDTVAFKDTFKILYEFMEKNKDVGVVGPKQFNLDGSVQDSCYHWHSLMTPIFRRTSIGKLKLAQKNLNNFLMKNFDKNSIKEVDWLLGSCFFCRAESLKKIGLFDERFFMYFEDTDLCRRFWQNNYKVVYNPEAKIIHNHQRESAKIPWYKILLKPQGKIHIESWIKYLLKWKGK